MKPLRHTLATDIPFARDDAHKTLPLMIACLIGFAALLLAVALSINTTLDDRSRDAIGTLEVEVPRSLATSRTAFATVVDTLSRTPGVQKVTPLSQESMEKLLKPWLGEEFSLAELPLPQILDVKTAVSKGKTAVDVEALGRSLARIDSGIRVEDRGPWVGHVAQATTLVQALVILVALMLLACVIGMIVLVSKTNLKLHFKVVSLLHMFGATDEYILRQFQWNSALLAARGAGIGVMAASALFLGGVILSMQWHSALLPEIHFSLLHIVVFLLLPVLTALIALVATRLTVQSMLEHMH